MRMSSTRKNKSPLLARDSKTKSEVRELAYIHVCTLYASWWERERERREEREREREREQV